MVLNLHLIMDLDINFENLNNASEELPIVLENVDGKFALI